MIVDVTNQVFGQFIDNVKNQLKAQEEASKAAIAEGGDAEAAAAAAAAIPQQEAKPLNAFQLILSIIWGNLMKLFGRKPKA